VGAADRPNDQAPTAERRADVQHVDDSGKAAIRHPLDRGLCHGQMSTPKHWLRSKQMAARSGDEVPCDGHFLIITASAWPWPLVYVPITGLFLDQ